MTVSFHKFGEYFPGTGDVKVAPPSPVFRSLNPVPCCRTSDFLRCWLIVQDTGHGEGKGYSLNFPLKDGMDDRSFVGIFRPVSNAQTTLTAVARHH